MLWVNNGHLTHIFLIVSKHFKVQKHINLLSYPLDDHSGFFKYSAVMAVQ